MMKIVPAWVTGRVGPRARREVQSWTQDNITLRTYRYGTFRKYLMWGTDHPVWFTLSVALLAAVCAYVLAWQTWTEPIRLPATNVAEDFDVAAYAGVPWSVQATLVALVYPIVLAFIALLLQRKAHSTVSLRVYILESAVGPAGASSVGLLLFMGLQYFATPYSSTELLDEFLAPSLVFNGTWLFLNVLLTGFFLTRTVRFLQEEEQRHAFTRVAVDVALRAELIAAVKQHIYVSAPHVDWGFPDPAHDEGSLPRVYTFALRDGSPVVRRDIRDTLVLHDVHLQLLRFVANRWARRARVSSKADDDNPPTLIFPARVGGELSGEVVLCSIRSGPELRWYERFIVKLAFQFSPAHQGTLSLTARRMLDEAVGEVESAAEQQRYGAAEERLRHVVRLHQTLLLAGAADQAGVKSNAATLGVSPYAWGNNTFDLEWIRPYIDLARIAVNKLEDHSRLFRALAAVPAGLASKLPPRPEALLVNVQLVGSTLAYQLGNWWTRKADASLVPGTKAFGGTLPAPLCKVYEEALVAFVGSWGHFKVNLHRTAEDSDEALWNSHCARALVYAKHIERSASFFLRAVARGDEAASVWFLDSYLKWWGNHESELRCNNVEADFRVRHVTLSIARKSWEQATHFLWDGTQPITKEFANQALNLAVRRYWESMRLFLILLLVEKADNTTPAATREIRLACALLTGTPQHDGARVMANSLGTADEFLTALLDNVFGVENMATQIQRFAEEHAQERDEPQVSGWIYSWSFMASDIESMIDAQTSLLLALESPGGSAVTSAKQLVESWWRDIEKLDQVKRYLADLQRELVGESSAILDAKAHAIKAHLGGALRLPEEHAAVANRLETLNGVALLERRMTVLAFKVDSEKIQSLKRLSAKHAFERSWLPAPLESLVFVQSVPEVLEMSNTLRDDRDRYLSGMDAEPDSGLAEHVGDAVRESMLAWCIAERISSRGLKPINSPDLHNTASLSHADMQNFLASVAAECAALTLLGHEAVILVGYASFRSLLQEYRWRSQPGQCPLPPGVTVSGASDRHPGAISEVNGTPVYEWQTPGQNCYVVPLSMLKKLLVEGSNLETALRIDWQQESEETLEFTLRWRAKLQDT